jgi:hypothetical protein
MSVRSLRQDAETRLTGSRVRTKTGLEGAKAISAVLAAERDIVKQAIE